MSEDFKHISVMPDECIEGLHLHKGAVVVDATLGGGGHSLRIAQAIGKQGRLIGIDQDESALRAARERLETIPAEKRPEIEYCHANFGTMDEILMRMEVPGVDAVLFDLGVSSAEIDNFMTRGFSYKDDGPLDMRMDPGTQTLTAAEILNTYNEADLARVIRDYSDERWASRIAQFIVRRREGSPYKTSYQLVDTIKAAIPAAARREGGNCCKRTYQALRVEVNNEYEMLRAGLDAAIRWLNPGGWIAVISFQSIEDRIVKETFARFENRCTCPVDLPVCACGKKSALRVVTKKPLVPQENEVAANSRAHSAKLRVAQRLEA